MAHVPDTAISRPSSRPHNLIVEDAADPAAERARRDDGERRVGRVQRRTSTVAA